MNLVLVDRFEVAAVCRPQDGVGNVFPDDLGDSFCDSLLDADYLEAEDVLSVGFVLRFSVDYDFWFDDDGVGAAKIWGRL